MAARKPQTDEARRVAPPSSATPHARQDTSVVGVPRATFLRSFVYAFRGIGYVVRTQRNMQVHIGIGAVAIVFGLVLGLDWGEWAALIVAMTLVYTLEMINTVIEATVDLVTREYHPLARVAKDAAAGAVLVGAIGAVAVGIVLFLPKILHIAFSLLGWVI